MDNYVLRLRPETVRKLADALRIRFNSPVRYKGKFYRWDTILRVKAQELANYVLGRRNGLDFSGPSPILHGIDSEAIRNLILSMTAADAKKRGIRKNTLWYLQLRARQGNPIQTYAKIRTKLSHRNV